MLRLAFDPGDPAARILGPLGHAVPAALLGALVWSHHDRLARQHSEAFARTVRLVVSGVALVAAASGVGVIVNSLLAGFGSPLAGAGVRPLLLGGISSLAVGGPAWWLAWRSAGTAAPEQTGRRIYLIAVFGLSAVSALVTLLVLGYRLFEFTLADHGGGALLDRVRAPLGLFIATGLVAIYHFSMWRRDREALAERPAPKSAVRRVILVAADGAEAQKRSIEKCTGAAVTLWLRADTAESAAAGGPTEDLLAEALSGVAGKRVLVVTGPGTAVQVIPLAD